MKLARFLTGNSKVGVGIVGADSLTPLNMDLPSCQSLAQILESDQPASLAESLAVGAASIPLDEVAWLPPIDAQEVWAAGVTYQKSQAARMEESEAAADCYDRVYRSSRPELFFKATPSRVVGHGAAVRVRGDSTWSVPEPEITLVLNSGLDLVGYTIGNDMSARDIEGDNPLYLPQAKVYRQCCALGPWITLADAMPTRESIEISLTIRRGENVVFSGKTGVAKMARTFEDLIGWLGTENEFPDGVFLLTGTGVVPDNDFTLVDSDEVEISISGIGSLVNKVVQATE